MNEHHRRVIGATFHHIDGRLTEVEAILEAVGARSPFSAYSLDIEPLARRSVEGYLQRLREIMWSATRSLEISTDGHRTSAAWAIRCAMIGVLVNIADMEPHRLAGYGALAPDTAKALAGICADLRRAADSLLAYLARSRGEDLVQRLDRLLAASPNRDVLAKIETIITRHGLVELRPMLENIAAKIESPSLEVAFFGRVSSGKSSLLNYLLGEKILPVGVLPVTAVLTRLVKAEENELVVRSEISAPQRLPIDRLAEFVTEEGNPGNERRVSEVEVRLANPRLAEGVAFIDTPGVGSLATSGVAQTKAYLPRCDLGILLVDAGTTLNEEDLALLHGFFDAAIPAMVLISKCDLLDAPDRDRVINYVKQNVLREIGSLVPIYLVSARQTDAALTDRWFAEALRPCIQEHRELSRQSVQRKMARLEELTGSYLEARMRRSAGSTKADEGGQGAPEAEAILRGLRRAGSARARGDGGRPDAAAARRRGEPRQHPGRPMSATPLLVAGSRPARSEAAHGEAGVLSGLASASRSSTPAAGVAPREPGPRLSSLRILCRALPRSGLQPRLGKARLGERRANPGRSCRPAGTVSGARQRRRGSSDRW